jgi:peptidyl-prolyl cis-trans isomerase D
MLTTIREKTQGIIATFILLLIVIPFALWGINSYFEGGSKVNVAKVDGVDISQQTYRNALDQFRGGVDPKLLENPDIKRLVVESLIDQTLLVRDAEAQGYRLSDARLNSLIRELPYFQRDGKFDPQLYEALLRREGLGMRDFEERGRAKGVTGQIQIGLSESVIVTEDDVAAVVRLLRQERDVAYTVVSAEKFLARAAVTPAAVEQYYTAHPEMFRHPEQVRVSYLRLSAEELTRGYTPSEEELRQAFDEEAGRLASREKRQASHILISLPPQATAEEARGALARIQGIERQARAGGDFAKLARKYSEDSATAAQGGGLGEIRRGLLPKELEQAVYALKPGAISQPIRTNYGYHLVKLTGVIGAARKPLSERRADLGKQIRQRKGEERFYELSEKFRSLVYEQPDSLEPAAQVLGLKVESSDWFTRSGGAGIAGHIKVVEAAFSPELLGQARNSDAIEVGAGILVAVRVIGHRPATPKPLAEVRSQIERLLRQESAQIEARRLGEDMLKELHAGRALEALARQHGVKYQPPKTVTRDQAQGFDRRIVSAALRAPRPPANAPVFGGVDLGSQGYAVYAVLRVREIDPAKADAALKEKARRLLAARRGADYYANYRAGLRKKSEIKIYTDKL